MPKITKVFVLIMYFSLYCTVFISGKPYKADITVRDIDLTVEVVFTDEDRAMGLMGRKDLGRFEGMLFIFDTEEYRSFWMKNMIISIDIIFIDRYGFIVDIKKECPPCPGEDCPSYSSRKQAMYVLEVVSGFSEEHGIRIGDRVIME